MKRFTVLLFVLIFAVCGLTGCGKYASHYNTVGHVYSGTSDSARTSFMELDGTEVFKLKCESGKTAEILYSGKLETGSLTVFYDCGEGKTELFSLNAGEEINACSDPFPADTVYIIMETREACQNGSFSFEISCD